MRSSFIILTRLGLPEEREGSIRKPQIFTALSKIGRFLPRDARSAKRGIAIVSRPSVRPSVRNVDVP